jgi:ketosteroid isomerase-like protein
MTLSNVAAVGLLVGLSLGCEPASEHLLTPEERDAIASRVGQLFDEIPQATNALQFGRLLSYYRDSDELTYVARGRVTRSHGAFADIMDAQFGGVVEADLRWLDIHIDVLSRDVAVSTATFEFTAILTAGDTARSSGTYTSIYVLRDGEWKIQYSAHSFPPPGRG